MMMNFYYFSTLLTSPFGVSVISGSFASLLTSNYEWPLKLSHFLVVFVLILIFWSLTNDSSAHPATTGYTMVQALLFARFILLR